MSLSRNVLTLTLVAVAGAAVITARAGLRPEDDYKFVDPILDVREALRLKYVEKVDDAKLIQGAIDGMIEQLNDPYTVYVPPANKAEFNKDLTGEYVGIGAAVNVINNVLTIVTPLEDSPAWEAGLMADDKVLEIDGKSTANLTVDDCIKLLTGTPGTSVKLTIERGAEKLNVEINRRQIKTKSVKGFHRDENDASKWLYVIDPARRIGYVRLTQFTPACSDEMIAALKSAGAFEGKLNGLVLDLRGNGGGLLREATRIADLFIKEGVIVSLKGRTMPDEVTEAESDGTLPDFPLVVLVNGQSASASEVLAGALADHKRAVVIGTRSFGKGLVQSVLNLPNAGGAELKVTEQRYYLPSGRCIQRTDESSEWGVDPSEGFYVPMTDDETIAMLRARRAEEIMRPQAQKAETTESWSDPTWIVKQLKDKQLGAAVEAIQAKIDTGEWKKTGETMPATKIAGGELQKINQARERLERELLRLDRRAKSLEEGGAQADANPEDFWPDALDLKGGRLQVYDKDGKLISTLKITGDYLERWLIDAGVKKDAGPGDAPAKDPT